MARDEWEGWPPYVPVAERRRNAEREAQKLRKNGHSVAPVVIEGRMIASSVWGKAWCANLEGYHDYESRLPRGRSYVRNGSVVDLQIAPRTVTALVSGSSLYKVAIRIAEVPGADWRAICRDCTGGIDSLVELLQGRLSKAVMERLCRQDKGLFPRPSQIEFSCNCLDHASMCKHVAAVLYGIGARLDAAPELLFRLRAVDETALLANLDMATPLAGTAPAAGRILAADDMSALFGLEMADDPAPVATASKRAAPPQPAARDKARTPPAAGKPRTARKPTLPVSMPVETPPAPFVRQAEKAVKQGKAAKSPKLTTRLAEPVPNQAPLRTKPVRSRSAARPASGWRARNLRPR